MSYQEQRSLLAATLCSWGTPYNSSIRYAPDLECPKGCRFGALGAIGSRVAFYKQIIGFSKEQPRSSQEPSCGIVLIECPHCFNKFWFHLREESVNFYVRDVPLWPQKDKDYCNQLFEI